MTHYDSTDALAHANPQKGFKIHLLVFLLVTPAIWVVWYVTNRSYPWPIWSTLGWGTGVLFHYLGVYAFKKKQP